MNDLRNGVLLSQMPAINISETPPTVCMLDCGTRFVVEIGKFEWLGHDGLYSEISLPDVPGCRFRVRHHQLNHAAGRTGVAGVFKQPGNTTRK